MENPIKFATVNPGSNPLLNSSCALLAHFQVENTLGEKFAVEINRLGLMTKFSERNGRYYDFAYNEETGLLLSVTTPGKQ